MMLKKKKKRINIQPCQEAEEVMEYAGDSHTTCYQSAGNSPKNLRLEELKIKGRIWTIWSANIIENSQNTKKSAGILGLAVT